METRENANLMTQSKGVVIVNYKELKKSEFDHLCIFGIIFLYANESCEKAFCIKR